jgi:tRNA pseudouridine38-40 synthase
MPSRVKLTVAYDGAAFAGWQSQAHRNTVQDELERALLKISSHRIRVHGAGRTDAGVHALAQCAHIDLPEKRMPIDRLRNALNAVLPAAVRILRCRYVSQKFHARFSATGKLYRYRIYAAPILPPLELGRAWHIFSPLDVDLLKSAGHKFIGTHNFAAFAVNRGKKDGDAIRTISSVRIRGTGPLFTIDVAGDGFLYKMVRLMVGSMARIALGKMELGEIASRLRSPRAHGSRFVAPAEGLYLVKIWY